MLSPDPLPLALFRPPIVLVVESRTAARTSTSRLLAALGYDARPARDGQQALRILLQYPSLHQLVLTNIVLPDMDGGQLAERVHIQGAGTRVALIAEYAPIGKAAAVIAAHPGIPVLRKPFGFRELYELLCPLIGPPKAALPLSGRAIRPSRRRHRVSIQ
ncbi:MAG: response regulator [Gemmatimonadales bacterium]|nr:response regulator [Gemmatimonadales bacterium]